jgi:hypothetical protein
MVNTAPSVDVEFVGDSKVTKPRSQDVAPFVHAM